MSLEDILNSGGKLTKKQQDKFIEIIKLAAPELEAAMRPCACCDNGTLMKCFNCGRNVCEECNLQYLRVCCRLARIIF